MGTISNDLLGKFLFLLGTKCELDTPLTASSLMRIIEELGRASEGFPCTKRQEQTLELKVGCQFLPVLGSFWLTALIQSLLVSAQDKLVGKGKSSGGLQSHRLCLTPLLTSHSSIFYF